MSRLEKLIAAIRNNPKDVRFDDACRVAEAFGFVGKSRGSHRAYSRPGMRSGLNFQNRDGKIAPYQARQLIDMIDQCEDNS